LYYFVVNREPKNAMTTSIRLAEDLRERLDAEAARQNRTRSNMIEVAVLDYLLRQEFERERMARTTETSHA